MKIQYSEEWIDFWYGDDMADARIYFTPQFAIGLMIFLLTLPGIGILLFIAFATKSILVSTFLFCLYLIMFPGRVFRKCFKMEWK